MKTMRSEVRKALCIRHDDGMTLIPIKIADLNLRMRQFNLRIDAKINWRPSGLPKWNIVIMDISYNVLYKTHGYDLNFILHEALRYIEKTFIENAEQIEDKKKFHLAPEFYGTKEQKDGFINTLSPSPSSTPPQELPPD